jgi:hypothetical protein
MADYQDDLYENAKVADYPTDRRVDQFKEAGFSPCNSTLSDINITRAMVLREHILRVMNHSKKA